MSKRVTGIVLEGMKAFYQNIYASDNPYELGSASRGRWSEGYALGLEATLAGKTTLVAALGKGAGEKSTGDDAEASEGVCASCRFWVGDVDGFGKRECHGGPPSAVNVAQNAIGNVDNIVVTLIAWPRTAKTDACGMHKRKVGRPFEL